MPGETVLSKTVQEEVGRLFAAGAKVSDWVMPGVQLGVLPFRHVYFPGAFVGSTLAVTTGITLTAAFLVDQSRLTAFGA